MRAIGKYIVIEPIKEETKASSGLIMTSTDENDVPLLDYMIRTILNSNAMTSSSVVINDR
jgi:hypothetical protein